MNGKARSTSSGENREKSKARTTDAGDGPSLLDVLEWSRTAITFITMNAGFTSETDRAVEVVQRLTSLARLGLEAPTPAQLRMGLLNDPYCHAAYTEGRRAGLRAADEERAGK